MYLSGEIASDTPSIFNVFWCIVAKLIVNFCIALEKILELCIIGEYRKTRF